MTAGQPKRVLIFALTYYPFVGGDGVALKEITDRLHTQEFVFDLVTLRFDSRLPKKETIGNITVHRIGLTKSAPSMSDLGKFPLYLAKVWFPVGAFFKALSLHKKHSYDALWSMMTYAGFPAVFFNMFYKNVPILLSLQDGDPIEKIKDRWRIKIVAPLFRRIFKIPTHVQTISYYLKDFAKDAGYSGEVSVIPNGVDVELFSKQDEEAVQRVKEELNKKEDDVWIIHQGRLVEKNAVGDIIRALPLLQKNVSFINIGIGDLEEHFKQLAKDLGVESRVHFLPYMPHEELIAYMHASDMFIRPSLSEGFGNSFIEAMAAKLPVIGTAEGGIVDFLKHKETGLICGTADSADLALKVEMILKDADLRDEMINNAYSMVTEKYDWNDVAEEMRGVLKGVVRQ